MATLTASSKDWRTAELYNDRVTSIMGVFLVVAIFGWVVSAFLSGIHFWGIPQIPPGAEVSGSLEVITSQWAYVFGIPLATLGGLYYITTIGMAVWWFDTKHPLILKVLTPMTATGVIASAYFVWLQLVPIGEICPFCMMSAGATVVLFGLELTALRMSSLPSLSMLTRDFGSLWQSTTFMWPLIVFAIGVLTLLAFFGATLAPVPTG